MVADCTMLVQLKSLLPKDFSVIQEGRIKPSDYSRSYIDVIYVTIAHAFH